MSETIDFLIRGKDMLSGMFPKIGHAAQTSYTQLNSLMARHNQTAGLAGKSINDLEEKLKKLHKRRGTLIDTNDLRQANQEIAAIERRINRMQGTGKQKSMMGAFIGGNLVAGGISSGIALAKQITMDSLNASMAYSMQERSFQVLARDAKKGKELAAELRSMKQSTLVGGGVYANAQTMMGFGVSERDVVRKLREVGDVGMGDQDRMQYLSLARAQVTAAGKLMGQDLLQFINAGFNPLSVMAERWKDFGFKTKVSIGELKELMSEGKISSGMVDKAFELATSKGGQFYKMMEQIGDTSGGKMLKMKGNWAAMQIDIGNSLMPMASQFMEAAAKAMHFVNIAKTVPDALRAEQMEVNTLAGSIVKLNEGNAVRADMIDRLRARFPDMFDGIDREKTKNEELLGMLDKVNRAYERRIQLANHKIAADVADENYRDIGNLAQKFATAAQSLREYGKSTLSVMDPDYLKAVYNQTYNPFASPKEQAAQAQALADHYNAQIENAQKQKEVAEHQVEYDRRQGLLSQATSLLGNPEKQAELWGKNMAKNALAVNEEYAKIMYTRISGTFLTYDFSKLEKLLNPAAKGAASDTEGVAGLAGKITGGGQKSVHITFKNVVENMNNHIAGGKGVIESIEPELEEMIDRLFSKVI